MQGSDGVVSLLGQGMPVNGKTIAAGIDYILTAKAPIIADASSIP